jgi:signal transduction histidine kinase
MGKEGGHTRLKGLKAYVLMLVIFWTVLVAAVLVWNLIWQHREAVDAARLQARSAFEKDIVYRQWAALHGGVYVPATEETPPNEHLADVAERDITTPSGRKLTLVNPAYMTRQVHDLGGRRYGLRGKITSLKPIRPENAPDAWEAESLKALEAGLPEVSSVEDIDSREYMRFIGPLITEQSCLTCHAAQGYKVGDIRGGVSVSVPMAPLKAIARRHIVSLATGHGLLWLLGVTGIAAGGWSLARRISERDRAQEALQAHKQNLEKLIDERTEALLKANEKLRCEIEDRRRLEGEILMISEREQRRIGRELHDSLGQQLTGAAIMSKVLEQKLNAQAPAAAPDATTITGLINQAINQTRNLSRGLHPVDVESGGLIPALDHLTTSTQTLFDVSCVFHRDEEVEISNPSVTINLYRIVQEAITNAIRHGRCRHIAISLDREDGAYIVSVESDGEDFPETIPHGRGMGLRIMEYRAQAIGAFITIGKRPGGGTRVACRCPDENGYKEPVESREET